MKLKKLHIVSFLLVVTIVINWYFRKCLDFGYAEVLPYNQLYFPDELFHISGIQWKKDDSIEIRFSGTPIKEKNSFIVYNNNVQISKQNSPHLKFKMLPSLKRYCILINSLKDTLTIDIDYTRSGANKSNSSPTLSSVEITPYSIPLGNKQFKSITDWKWDLSSDNTEIKIINSYLRDSMNLVNSDRSETKVKKIAAYILRLTKDCYGTPSDSLKGLGAVQQLNAARKKLSALWCGNYAYLFSFFAQKAGLTTRMIESGALEGGTINSPHVFNEVYLEEYNSWAYVDLTDGNVFVKRNNKLLNAADIYRLLRYNSTDEEILAVYYDRDKFVDTAFYKTGFFGQKALNYNNTLRFYYGNYRKITTHRNAWQRLMNFIYAKPYYAIYSDNIGLADSQFYLRLISNYLLIAITLLWLFFAAKLISSLFLSK